MADPPEPDMAGLTIARRDFEAVRRTPRFAKRPYGCVVLVREGYFAQTELLAALAGLGVRTVAVPVGARGDAKAAFLDRLLQAILAHRPDFILTLSHTGVDPEGDLVTLLADLRLPLASWLLDSPDLLLASSPQLADAGTVIFSCDAGALAPIRAMGYRHVHFLPLAASPGRLVADPPSPPAAFAATVSFVGDSFVAETGRRLKSGRFGRELVRWYPVLARRMLARPERSIEALATPEESRLLARYQALTPAARRLDFALAVACRANTAHRAAILSRLIPFCPLIVGPADWRTVLGPEKTAWRWLPPLYDDRVAALFRSSMVNCNITSRHMHGAANQRVFDVPAAGGFLLTEASPQLEALFEPGRELATYAGPDDVSDQCARFAADPAARAAITTAARRRIALEHTYAHRAARMLATLKALR
mgnify:CR=1 FL=1